MSRENVKKFLEEIAGSEELRTKLQDCIKGHSSPQSIICAKLVELGQEKGLSFTEKDVQELTAELADKLNETNEMQDEDLMAVAGGKGNPPFRINEKFVWKVALSVLQAVVGCFIISAMQKQGCAMNQ